MLFFFVLTLTQLSLVVNQPPYLCIRKKVNVIVAKYLKGLIPVRREMRRYYRFIILPFKEISLYLYQQDFGRGIGLF